MYVSRALPLPIVCALFYAVLYVAGKVPAPNMNRLNEVGQATRSVTTGAAHTAGEVAGSAASGYRNGAEREP